MNRQLRFLLLILPILLAPGCVFTDIKTPESLSQAPHITDTPTIPSPTATSSPVPSATSTPLPILQKIAFVGSSAEGESTLWIMDEKGEELQSPFPQIINIRDIHWSPDGNWLAFAYSEDGMQGRGVRIFNPHTNEDKTLPDFLEAWSLTWSPDGNKLAFYSMYVKEGYVCQAVVYSMANGSVQYLDSALYEDPGLGMCPRWVKGWSSDGIYLLLDAGTGGNRNLKIVDVLRDEVVADFQSMIYQTPFISPDGTLLALGLTEGFEGDEIYDPSVTIINLRSGNREQIVVGTIFEDDYRVVDWLPDGRILYSWDRRKESAWETTYWYFNPGQDSQPQPATDYIPPEITASTLVKRLPIDKSTLWIKGFSVSPDKTKVVFSVLEESQENIYFLDWKSGDLIGPIAEGNSPEWQPDHVIASPSSASATPVTTPSANTAEFKQLNLLFWEVFVEYDSNRWQPGGQQYVPALTHQLISNCVIYEQGPTEPPDIDKKITLGEVEYQVSELFINGEHVDWYMAVGDSQGPFPGGLPTLVVQSSPNQRDACLVDAEIVLATMARITSGNVSNRDSSNAQTSCPGAPPQRMVVNQRGYVCTKKDRVLVRSNPDRSGSEITRLPPGTYFTVIDGPSCANNWSWWQIRTDNGLTGWIAEGGDQVDSYFICPGS